MQKPYEKGQVQWQEDMEKVHVYMPKMHTRYHASLWEQTYQKSYDQLIFSKFYKYLVNVLKFTKYLVNVNKIS